MTDWTDQYKSLEEANEAALASLEREQRKLSDITKTMSEATTTVKAKDRSLTVDFDGRGEITAINFHGTKYRGMAPAELSHVLMETIQSGRAQCLQKLADVMGEDILPGVNFADLASGRMNAEEILDKVVSPFLGDTYGDGILGRKSKD
ncbi:YbaB/EbfC family nucleoid-associated protein [Amycolatopsis sp. NPDC059657]|uniref:YbaB/EbfC family nucleoid-associated protein n=1 Tax=Amycolatopsis sp. NPDC059657 TaxID=3346899 RepID=UPI00366C1784